MRAILPAAACAAALAAEPDVLACSGSVVRTSELVGA